MTFRKKKGRERLIFSSELVEMLADRATDRGPELAGRQEALIDCLQKLPDHARELIRHYYVLGLKLREAAAQLGRGVAATEKAIVRIRRILYDCVNATLRKPDEPVRKGHR